MTVVVDNLEKMGLVERHQVANDRRSTFAYLTPKGKKTFSGSFRITRVA